MIDSAKELIMEEAELKTLLVKKLKEAIERIPPEDFHAVIVSSVENYLSDWLPEELELSNGVVETIETFFAKALKEKLLK